MTKSNTIPVILGPTSSGKTTLALDLCSRFECSMLSADSRQIYKFMDIGTGKVPIHTDSSIEIIRESNRWLFSGIPIYGYDITTPGEYYSASDYVNYAINTAREVVSKNQHIFIVGGTGFYIDLITGRAKTAGIKPDFSLRAKLESETTSTLVQLLTSLNSNKASTIDTNNRVRLIRAIEIESAQKKSSAPLPYLENYKFKFIGLTSSREHLYSKVDTWAEIIWENGLVDETKTLINLGFKNTTPLQGLIYRDVIKYLEGEHSKSEAIQKCKYSLHAYIRRQETWFKRNTAITWYDITKSNLGDTIYTELKNL